MALTLTLNVSNRCRRAWPLKIYMTFYWFPCLKLLITVSHRYQTVWRDGVLVPLKVGMTPHKHWPPCLKLSLKVSNSNSRIWRGWSVNTFENTHDPLLSSTPMPLKLTLKLSNRCRRVWCGLRLVPWVHYLFPRMCYSSQYQAGRRDSGWWVRLRWSL